MKDRRLTAVFAVVVLLAVGLAAWLLFDSGGQGEAGGVVVPGAARTDLGDDDALPEGVASADVVPLKPARVAPPELPAEPGALPEAYRASLGGLIGRVIEPDGTPVPDMTVEVVGGRTTLLAVPRDLRYTDAPADLDLIQGAAVTDDEGRFHIADLEPRTLGVLVVDPGGPRTVVRVLDISPVSGETRDLGDIVLADGVTLRGQVVDARGQPLADARVRATDLDYAYIALGGVYVAEFQVGGGILVEPPDEVGAVRPVLGVPTPAQARLLDRLPIPQTRTDVEGRFEIAGVPVGLATLLVDDGEHLPTAQGPIPTGVAGGERDVGRIILQDGRTLRGQVVDAQGEPVAGARVMAGSDIVGIPVQATVVRPPRITDDEGRFELRGLRDATVSLAVTGPGALEPHFMLGEPLPLDELRVVLPGKRTLKVTLRDGDDRPVTGASFYGFALIGEDADDWQQYIPAYVLPNHALADRTTPVEGEEGSYLIADLDPFVWRFTVKTPGHALTHEQVDLTEDDGELTLRMAAAHAFDVRVVRADDASPLVHVSVEAWAEGSREAPFTAGRTDADGRVRLFRLEPGAYTLRATHPALAITELDVKLPEINEATIPMTVGGTIRGQALDRGGPPVEPVLITLEPRGGSKGDGQMPRLALSDPDGNFVFTNVEAGKARLTAVERLPNLSGFSFVELFINTPLAKTEVTVPAAGEVDALLLLGSELDGMQTAWLQGRVIVNGRAVEGWKVRCWGEIRRSAVTLADGSFDLGMVSAGESKLTVGPSGGSLGPIEGIDVIDVDLEEGETRFLNVSLSTGSVAGSVRAAGDGRLIEGVAVRVVPDGEQGNDWLTRRETVTLGDGRFEMTPVTTGTYKLRAERDGYATGWSEPFEVRELQAVRGLEVVLTEALLVKGTVVLQGVDDPGGWMWLMASTEGSERSGATRVDSATGAFEMENLGPGTYTFRIATGADVEFAPIVVELATNTTDLLLTFEAATPSGAGFVYDLK